MARRKTTEEQLAELEAQKSRLDARVQKKRAAVRASKRKQDTRRKIIAGALALDHADIDAEFGRKLARLINEHVTRPEDRKLFGLDPTPQPVEEQDIEQPSVKRWFERSKSDG